MISSGTTGWDPNPGRLAVAENILGPWKELGDPSRGTEAENKTTFWSQSTYILPVNGKKNAFIVATLISIVGYALKWWGFDPGNPWLMFLPIPFLFLYWCKHVVYRYV